MPLMINTNIASLNAQNNLSTSQTALQTSLQRLSSGLRINSAKDDAAGLSIATRMSSQINGLNQAARNANDGISMSQTAEGAMSTISTNLQRMRDLAVQAANGSNSQSDRTAIQSEIVQLKGEINRVATQTQFNGTNLLDGTLNNAQFQVGANANQTINFSIGNAQATAIGNYQVTSNANSLIPKAFAGAGNNLAAGGTITLSGNGATTAALTVGIQETADKIAATVNASNGNTGVTATASNTVVLSGFTAGTATSLTIATRSLDATANVTNSSSITISNSTGSNDLAGLVDQVNQQTGNTGISATYDATAGTVTLSNSTGQDISLTGVNAGGQAVTVKGASDAAGTALAAQLTVGGTVTYNSASSFSVTDTSSGTTGAATATASALQNVAGVDVTTVAGGIPTGADNAITIIDAALLSINNAQAAMGAVQNRFTTVITNLNTTAQNLTQSRSRIQDTDFAAETASLTRGQILQQAGTAMLAQANSLPNGVMALLK